MTSLLVGTRKGLFVVDDKQITVHHFQGESVSQVLIDPRSKAWLVALNLGHFGVKLHKSVDHGKTWTVLAAPAFSAKPVAGDSDFDVYKDDPTPWNVELIWSLSAGGADEPTTAAKPSKPLATACRKPMLTTWSTAMAWPSPPTAKTSPWHPPRAACG